MSLAEKIVTMSAEEQVDAVAAFNHEVSTPLRGIHSFTELINRKEPELPQTVTAYFAQLQSVATRIDNTAREVTLESKSELQDRMDQIECLLTELETIETPTDYGFIDESSGKYMDHVQISTRTLLFTLGYFFGLERQESFFLKPFIRLQKEIYNVGLSYDGPHNLELQLEYQIVMDNLLGNARKYAFKGVRNPQIAIVVEEADTEYMVVVKDNGNGIDTSKVYSKALELDIARPHGTTHAVDLVFEKGISTGGEGHGTSEGIGLYTVRNIVRKNGGIILVNSTNMGTSFTFTIPR